MTDILPWATVLVSNHQNGWQINVCLWSVSYWGSTQMSQKKQQFDSPRPYQAGCYVHTCATTAQGNTLMVMELLCCRLGL
jgi:hypothetical protein